MNDPQIIKHKPHFRFLLLFSVLYCSTLLLSGLYVYRPVTFLSYNFAASSLIYPLSYAFNDIICEVYGYQNSRRLIWFGLIAVFFFAFVTKILNALPQPTGWNNQSSYMVVLGSYLRLSIAGLIGMLVGEFLNAIALSKWKALLRGRFFWIRSVGSTSVGSAIDTGVEYIVAFAGLASNRQIVEMLLFAYLFRIAYAAVMAIPSTVIVEILKRLEGTDKFVPLVTYNPFSLKD